jgi:hypothetical protein
MQADIDAALQRAHRARDTQSVTGQLRWHSPTAGAMQSADVRYQISADRQVAQLRGLSVDLQAPQRLASVAIAKPWGQEIWFTGMEARGESAIAAGEGRLALPAYLALAPQWLTGNQPLVLLKILDPKPEPVLGDLYFEVHREKRESYVVTAVDRRAWPDGIGAIRFGVSQAEREAAASDDAFRAAYLAAIQSYERVRRSLDDLAWHPAANVADAELEAARDARAAGDPAPLAELESARRAAMNRYTQLQPLQVGDIVQVPPWQPHALQHGVRVVEFQTPTYERYIISFAQQVLTQDHWDSETALARMSLAPQPLTAPPTEALPPGQTRVARYDDFGALRVQLKDADGYQVPQALPYLVGICIAGTLRCGTLTLAAGEAFFLPRLAIAAGARLQADRTAGAQDDPMVLIAAPGL